MKKPLALSDGQLDQIYRSAASLAPSDRGSYLERVAEMLGGHEIDDGLVGRVTRAAQQEFIRSPEMEPRRVPSRWMRPR